MQTLRQYLRAAKVDYTHACVTAYLPGTKKKIYKQISGDIDFVRKYFKNDPYGTALMLSGRFSPGECHASSFNVEVTCTYRLCDSH